MHFFLDDYQFERLWNSPREYVELLKQLCHRSDFSLYMDVPYPSCGVIEAVIALLLFS